MQTIDITLKLPADLVRDAAEFDLLSAEKIEAILREELDRVVMAQVNAEVKAHRAEKRRQAKQKRDAR